jgi:hypothetical protein
VNLFEQDGMHVSVFVGKDFRGHGDCAIDVPLMSLAVVRAALLVIQSKTLFLSPAGAGFALLVKVLWGIISMN